jgi:hypothetical protein
MDGWVDCVFFELKIFSTKSNVYQLHFPKLKTQSTQILGIVNRPSIIIFQKRKNRHFQPTSFPLSVTIFWGEPRPKRIFTTIGAK